MSSLCSSSSPPPGGGGGAGGKGGVEMSPLVEWVEIIEPRTKEHMFANLTTGECAWDPPPGAPVKRTSDDQWWELFDQNTSRFYYYNAASQRTVWHRPEDCDIIPLAKLQTLKQNTEVSREGKGEEEGEEGDHDGGDRLGATAAAGGAGGGGESAATQTAEVLLDRMPSNGNSSFRSRTKAFLSTITQTSPTQSPKAARRPVRPHRHHHQHHLYRHHHHQHQQEALSEPRSRQQQQRQLEEGGKMRLWQQEQQLQQQQQQLDEEASYSSPQKKKKVVAGRSSEDRRRTTIGPAQAKYYSIPNRGSSNTGGGGGTVGARGQQQPRGSDSSSRQQRSLNTEQRALSVAAAPNGGPFSSRDRQQHTWVASADRSPFSSVSRSMSFVSRQQQARDAEQQEQKLQQSGRQAEVVSPVEGFCTPMINRKQRQQQQQEAGGSRGRGGGGEHNRIFQDGFPKRRPQRGEGGSRNYEQVQASQSSPPREQQQQPSISELVDSGLSTLTDGARANHAAKGVVMNNNGGGGGGGGRSQQVSPPKPSSQHLKDQNRLRRSFRADATAPAKSISPLQQYILEQAKMSGYRLGDHHHHHPGLDGDRDSFVESEDDLNSVRHLDSSDDFADDEDGGVSADELSKASSVDEGDDDDGRYLSEEPTYNNLDPVWLRSLHGYQPRSAATEHRVPLPHEQHQAANYSQPSPTLESTQDVDAFSQEFDVQMRLSHGERVEGGGASTVDGGGGGGRSRPPNSSTMPRPASHQPTSSLQHQPQQQHVLHHQQQQQQYQQNPNFPVPYEVLHPSLQRNTHSLIEPPTSSSTMHRTGGHGGGGGGGGGRQRPGAVAAGSVGRGSSSLSVSASLHSESDIERYAQDNLNVGRRGLFRRKVSVRDLLTYTREPIRRPLTCLADKQAKKEAVETFRLVQIYMGDRRAKPGMTINSVALDVTTRGFAGSDAFRDEIFVQLCKQTTDNSNSARESLRRGWELMAICLSFFPPSHRFAPALHAYVQRHRDPALDFPDVGRWPIHVQISHYAGICAKRLDRIGVGGRLQPRKPTVEDIDQARLQIFRPSMFGGTLEEIMEMQQDRFPQRRLPWILTTLADQLLKLGGPTTEGIFRVPADLDEVMSMKSRFDQWEAPVCVDCHTAASLLKLWLRELYEPLIPDQLYDRCVAVGDLPDSAASDISAEVSSIVSLLPEPNRLVLGFLARLLQLFARLDVAASTKMDASNLGTVFAPNCLRCPSQDPAVILENARREMGFVKALIFHLDTSGMEGVL